MGASLNVYRTFDEAEILAVLENPAIMKTIKEDGGKLHVDPEASCFVAAKVDDDLAACFIFHKLGAVCIDVHAHVLPHQRHKSREIGSAIMRFIIDHAPWVQKFNAQIPFCYPNVKQFACDLGMQVEGINRHSYKKDGKVFDKWFLGATTQEIQNVVDR